MTTNIKNPFAWLEIYVSDMSRAQKFYETVFATNLTEMNMPYGSEDMQMLQFPSESEYVTGGALVKMDGVNPGVGGTLIYFTCVDCKVEEDRVEAAGGKIVQSKQSIGEYGYISTVMDTEGNMIGLYSMN